MHLTALASHPCPLSVCLPARSGSSSTLMARIESGAASVTASSWASALLVAAGRDPWELLQRGVTAAARMSGALLAEQLLLLLLAFQACPADSQKKQQIMCTAPQLRTHCPALTACGAPPSPAPTAGHLQAPPSTAPRRRLPPPWTSLASAPGTPSIPRLAAAGPSIWVVCI